MRPQFDSWVAKVCWKRDRLLTPVFVGFPGGSSGRESAWNAGLIPGSGRFPGEEKGYPLQYSSLENSMDCIVHGVTKNWTWLSDFMEKGMATHSSFRAWRIPWTEQPGGVPSIESQRVGHYWKINTKSVVKDEGGVSVWAGLQPFILPWPDWNRAGKHFLFLLGHVSWLAHVSFPTRDWIQAFSSESAES